MLYLSKIKTKIILSLFCGLVCFHFSFLSSKSYSAKIEKYQIHNVSEEQYLSCLNSLPYIDDKTAYVNSTEVKYVFGLTGETIYLIYIGYFLIVTGLIISAKIKLNDKENEK